MSSKKQVCCLCGAELEGEGNNPYPLAKKGRCCDKCNWDVVMARLKACTNNNEEAR